jgi:hypothetical protein
MQFSRHPPDPPQIRTLLPVQSATCPTRGDGAPVSEMPDQVSVAGAPGDSYEGFRLLGGSHA